MVLRSIGYRSSAADDAIPFDERRGVVHSAEGRVLRSGEGSGDGNANANANGAPLAGVYCAGWLKRGPSGIIGTNIPDAVETVTAIVADSESGAFERSCDAAFAELDARLGSGGSGGVVSWPGFESIDALEVARGSSLGKPREKLVRRSELLAAAAAAAAP